LQRRFDRIEAPIATLPQRVSLAKDEPEDANVDCRENQANKQRWKHQDAALARCPTNCKRGGEDCQNNRHPQSGRQDTPWFAGEPEDRLSRYRRSAAASKVSNDSTQNK
jgi:hypothetical protein